MVSEEWLKEITADYTRCTNDPNKSQPATENGPSRERMPVDKERLDTHRGITRPLRDASAHVAPGNLLPRKLRPSRALCSSRLQPTRFLGQRQDLVPLGGAPSRGRTQPGRSRHAAQAPVLWPGMRWCQESGGCSFTTAGLPRARVSMMSESCAREGRLKVKNQRVVQSSANARDEGKEPSDLCNDLGCTN